MLFTKLESFANSKLEKQELSKVLQETPTGQSQHSAD